MPPTRHASQSSGGSCYKLIARLRDCAQTVELNGFRSIPEAQAGLAGFVVETAQLGEISDLCLERRDATNSSNAAAQTTLIKRWNAEFAARILRQQNLQQQPSRAGTSAEPLANPSSADLDSKVLDERCGDTRVPATINLERLVDFDGRVPPSPTLETRQVLGSSPAIANPPPPEFPRGVVEPIHLLAEVIGPHEFPGKVAGCNGATHRTPIANARPAKYSRPAGNHRRTRWELAIAIMLTAAVAFTILIWDSGGDPISLFMPRAAATMPRDSLPFQVRPATNRNSTTSSPTEP